MKRCLIGIISINNIQFVNVAKNKALINVTKDSGFYNVCPITCTEHLILFFIEESATNWENRLRKEHMVLEIDPNYKTAQNNKKVALDILSKE